MEQQANNLKSKIKVSLVMIFLCLILTLIGLFILALNTDGQSSKYIYIRNAHILQKDATPTANYTGTWIHWRFNGKKMLEQEYLNGLEHGTCILYDDRGGKHSELTKNKGKMHGVTRQWYPNGKLKTQSFYKESKPHGKSQHWSKSGELIADGEYVEGSQFEGTFVRLNPFNKIDKILEYKSGKLIKEKKYNP